MKASAARNLPFGHSTDAAVDIEGLSVSLHIICSVQCLILVKKK